MSSWVALFSQVKAALGIKQLSYIHIFLYSYQKVVETYKNQVLHQFKQMCQQHADKCCHNLGCSAGRSYFHRQHQPAGQDKLIKHLQKDCSLYWIKNPSQVVITTNFVNSTIKSHFSSDYTLLLKVSFHQV